MTAPEHYVYLNDGLIRTYAEQLPKRPAMTLSRSSKMKISLLGQSYERSKQIAGDADRTLDQLRLLREELLRVGKLALHRPIRAPRSLIDPENPNRAIRSDRVPEFVEETFVATRVDLPVTGTGPIARLRQITLWLSDPSDDDITPKRLAKSWKWDGNWNGTYLILIETVWERIAGDISDHGLSGCSALQAVANIASNRGIFTPNFEEPLGRSEAEHPIDKLVKFGGVKYGKRTIKALYRTRYMSDEQISVYRGKPRRFNDLLGYPLYIIDAR